LLCTKNESSSEYAVKQQKGMKKTSYEKKIPAYVEIQGTTVV
jgi:hypothetical protein